METGLSSDAAGGMKVRTVTRIKEGKTMQWRTAMRVYGLGGAQGCVGLQVAASPIVWALTWPPVGLKLKSAGLLCVPSFWPCGCKFHTYLYLRSGLDCEGGSGRESQAPSSPPHGVAADE